MSAIYIERMCEVLLSFYLRKNKMPFRMRLYHTLACVVHADWQMVEIYRRTSFAMANDKKVSRTRITHPTCITNRNEMEEIRSFFAFYLFTFVITILAPSLCVSDVCACIYDLNRLTDVKCKCALALALYPFHRVKALCALIIFNLDYWQKPHTDWHQ